MYTANICLSFMKNENRSKNSLSTSNMRGEFIYGKRKEENC